MADAEWLEGFGDELDEIFPDTREKTEDEPKDKLEIALDVKQAEKLFDADQKIQEKAKQIKEESLPNSSQEKIKSESKEKKIILATTPISFLDLDTKKTDKVESIFITPDILDKVYFPLLNQSLTAILGSDAVQKAAKEVTRKGYDSTGFGYQYLVNMLNKILGLSHWDLTYGIIELVDEKGRKTHRYMPNGEVRTISITSSTGKSMWQAITYVSIAIGNVVPIKFDDGTTAWRFESIYQTPPMPGVSQNFIEYDAIKGAITNGFKRTISFTGLGREAYEGSIDDDIKGESSGESEGKNQIDTKSDTKSIALAQDTQLERDEKMRITYIREIQRRYHEFGWTSAAFRVALAQMTNKFPGGSIEDESKLTLGQARKIREVVMDKLPRKEAINTNTQK